MLKSESIKQKIIDFYYQKGNAMGMWLLKNTGITAICVAAFVLLIGEYSFGMVLGMLVGLPLFSILVIIVRSAIGLVHKIIPMQKGIIKFIFDFIIFCFVILAISYFLGQSNYTESEVLTTIILSLVGIAYVALMIFLLMANKLRAKKDANVEAPVDDGPTSEFDE